ncbi:MAG: hypothetical protein AB1414_19130 [bacterium]
MDSLPETFRKIISFLEEEKFDYLVIGGLASATLGEPRMTQDVVTVHRRDDMIKCQV